MSRPAALYIPRAVSDFAVIVPFIAAALLTALASAWVLRAFRKASPGAKPKRTALALMAAAGLGVLGVYLIIGAPGAPGGAFAPREEALLRADPATFQGEEWRAYLSAKARRAPANPEPVFLLGVVEQRLGDPQAAARAFEEALRRDPTLAPAMVELGRVLFQLDQGRVTPRAQALFAAAAERLPNEPMVWFYQALGAEQDGRVADARRFWRETQRLLPADDPRQTMIAQRIAASQDAAEGRP